MGFFKYALANLFKKPVTVIDPHRDIPVPDLYRGELEFNPDECILCGLCARACPANALEVDRKERKWRYNPIRCISCGRCADVCKKGSLEIVNKIREPCFHIEIEEYVIPKKEKKKGKTKKTVEKKK